MALLEAGSVQLPILATKINATKNIINETMGTLIELEDLSAGMDKVSNDYEGSIKLADNFYQKILKAKKLEFQRNIELMVCQKK